MGIITQHDLFKAIISLTGMGKSGVQFSVRVRDRPGAIKEMTDIIQNYGAVDAC